MFFAALSKSKVMNIISSLGGIATMLWTVVMIIELNDWDTVFDFECCATTIGLWIPFALFIICFILSIRISTQASNNIPA